MPVIDSHSHPALYSCSMQMNSKFKILPSKTEPCVTCPKGVEIGAPVNNNINTTAARVSFELFLTSSNHQQGGGGGNRAKREAEARQLNGSLFPLQNFNIVPWHRCEVLMTMEHPGCEVIQRKPSLAEAGRVFGELLSLPVVRRSAFTVNCIALFKPTP